MHQIGKIVVPGLDGNALEIAMARTPLPSLLAPISLTCPIQSVTAVDPTDWHKA